MIKNLSRVLSPSLRNNVSAQSRLFCFSTAFPYHFGGVAFPDIAKKSDWKLQLCQ